MNQRGYLQIIIALIIIAGIALVVLNYLNNVRIDNISGSDDVDTSINSKSPHGIIESVDDKMQGIEDQKNKEIEEYLNY
jgi:hypothetical protein